MLKKPEKLAKPRGKAKAVIPADQLMLETECGFCHKHFPSPTHASHHLNEAHEGQYANT